MTTITTKESWETYCTEHIAWLTPILTSHGYTLDREQPHIQGERFLMHAITTTSGYKLILLGIDQEGKRVVIKASCDEGGIAEINHERLCRNVLAHIDFARDVFHTPSELEYIKTSGYVISIQRFIDQESTFLARPLEAQFMLALGAFKGQEGAHATTFKHRALIANTFGIRSADMYLKTFPEFTKNIQQALPDALVFKERLETAYTILEKEKTIIQQYCGFLTHTDFVPHNIRIQGTTIYLLDHSSLTFGNKYEGWARFINFMTLYNPPLQKALEQYVKDNRTPEESVSLRMMRIYRLGEIIWYYVRTLKKSENQLHTLNTARIEFWSDVLASILKGEEVPESRIDAYTHTRDSLRSADEKIRQRGLH